MQKYVLGHPVDTPALILLFIELFAVRVRRVRKFRKFNFLLSLNSKLLTQTKKEKNSKTRTLRTPICSKHRIFLDLSGVRTGCEDNNN